MNRFKAFVGKGVLNTSQKEPLAIRASPAFFLDEIVCHPELQGVHTKRCCNHRHQQFQVWALGKPRNNAICRMLCGSLRLVCYQEAVPKPLVPAQAMESGPRP